MWAAFVPAASIDSTSFCAKPRSTSICSFPTVTFALLKPGSCAQARNVKKMKRKEPTQSRKLNSADSALDFIARAPLSKIIVGLVPSPPNLPHCKCRHESMAECDVNYHARYAVSVRTGRLHCN